MMVLSLQPGVVYGPIRSRRLGSSLGINLMPGGYKLCSFDCVYCHYGHTRALTLDLRSHHSDLPAATDVLATVRQALGSSLPFDFLTFSGNGEPTLHPDFPAITRGVAELRNSIRPQVKIALLSNSSGLCRKDVRRALELIDVPIFKLDAGTEVLFHHINRPAPAVSFDRILGRLRRLQRKVIQTVIMHGEPSNSSEEAVAAYCRTIEKIKPREVQLYSLDRPVADRRLIRVAPGELESIAGRCARLTGVRFSAYHM